MISLKLDKILNKLGLSMNKLSVASGVRPNTISDLVKHKSQRIDIDSLEKILDALNSISEKRELSMRFGVSDIIEYQYKK